MDWQDGADAIDRQVRALNPWPGVWTVTGAGTRLKILGVHLVEGGGKGKPGEVLNRQGDVLCGGGRVLRLVTVQPENAKAMDFAAAVNGNYVRVGELFGQ